MSAMIFPKTQLSAKDEEILLKPLFLWHRSAV